jgi:undecaprenyl-diphosphatase
MDTSLFFLINNGMQNAVFDLVMPFITDNADIFFAVFILLASLKDWRKGVLVFILCMIGLAVADAGGYMLKHLFERPRPCNALQDVRLLVGCGRSFSFPSNHALNAFAITAIFAHFFRKAALPAFFVAFLVAFSRIYIGVHYPSDVVAGALAGGVVAGGVLFLHSWSSEGFKKEPHSTALFISLLAITFFRYYYLVSGPIGLGPDEAHYWDWSRRLDLSYYSKGPLIAYLIASTTRLMGDTVFAVRFYAPLFSALSSVFIYLITMELFHSRKKAWTAAIVFQVTPLFSVYGIIHTTDSPLIFFWTLSLFLFWKAIQKPEVGSQKSEGEGSFTVNSEQPTVNGIYWVLLGCSLGLGLLAKYSMAFFYVCAVCFFVSSRQRRSLLRTKGPYLALLLSLLIFSPVIYWNAGHNWVAVRHAAGQAHASEGIKISVKAFFNFIGSQIGVITPFLFVTVMCGSVRNYIEHHRSRTASFLFWFWAPVLLIFLVKSIQAKVQANWAMTAYITSFIAAADYYLGKDVIRKGTKLFIVLALVTALCVTAVAHYPALANLPVKMDPSSRLRGWEALGKKAGEVYKDMIMTVDRVFVFSDKYQVTSELAFYMPGKPRTFDFNLGRRMNQYDIWGGIEDLLGYDALYVRMGDKGFPVQLKDAFDSYEKEIFIVYEKDRVLRKYSLFRCYGFKGLPSKRIESY